MKDFESKIHRKNKPGKMNVGKERNFKMFLPYQMKKMEIKSNGHLSNLIIRITSMSQSPTSSLIISCSNHQPLQCIFLCLLFLSSSV